jgi:hypothetical protein
MLRERSHSALQLSYASSPRRTARFTCGSISFLLAVVNAWGVATSLLVGDRFKMLSAATHNYILEVGWLAASAGLLLGISGIFIKPGRRLAVWGVCLALAELILLPSFLYG